MAEKQERRSGQSMERFWRIINGLYERHILGSGKIRAKEIEINGDTEYQKKN